MGGSLSFSLRESRKATWNKKIPAGDYGQPFVKLIADDPLYGPWISSSSVYELKLINQLPNVHWYLLIKKEGSDLPYISVEITTPDLMKLIPTTRNFESCDVDATDVDPYKGSLLSLCELADEVIKEMGTYDLTKRNCQHFCNRLLKKLYKEEFPTTFESHKSDNKFDYLTEICPDVSEVVSESVPESVPGPQSVPESVRQRSVVKKSEVKTSGESFDCRRVVWSATKEKEIPELKYSKPGPPPTCTIDDLATLVNILVPIQNNWQDLGIKLAINPQKLENIGQKYGQMAHQCLREMLREYLQHHYPPPTWDKLANHVCEYNRSVALAIMRKGEHIATL